VHPRANELIRILGLKPHPEGGHFAEVFRSPLSVSPADGRAQRSAITVIYFLLVQGAFSRWHRVLSDEAWHWYEGEPLELLTVRPDGGNVLSTKLGPLSDSSAPQHVVPAGWWQAARPLGAYALVGCSVGPGFDYGDFKLLSAVPEAERPVFDPKSMLRELL
jgi:predicted cupin superfamily sugar epimerase